MNEWENDNNNNKTITKNKWMNEIIDIINEY